MKFNLRTLITASLLGGLSCVVTINAGENIGAPEQTDAEAKLSFRDMPFLKPAYISANPGKRNDGRAVGELGVDGGSKEQIVKLAQEIAASKHGNYDSLLISHQGKLLFESYYQRARVNLAHGQASATKAYTSLVLGRAMQLGYLTMADLDKPLISFLKEIDTSKLAKGAEKITLDKALTMHGGLTIDRDKWKEVEKTPEILQGQRLVQTLLEQSAPITEASQGYLYGNYNPMLVMAVIDAVVPGTAREFIDNEILKKLGVTNYQWQTHISGLPEAGWRVKMTSRDMLKWGDLVINKGKWQGEQFIPLSYLNRATAGLVKPTQDWMPKDYRYGYFWYQTGIKVGNKTYNAKFAWGGGGQRVVAIEDLDLVVVITGVDREDQLMAQVEQVIVPAFVN